MQRYKINANITIDHLIYIVTCLRDNNVNFLFNKNIVKWSFPRFVNFLFCHEKCLRELFEHISRMLPYNNVKESTNVDYDDILDSIKLTIAHSKQNYNDIADERVDSFYYNAHIKNLMEYNSTCAKESDMKDLPTYSEFFNGSKKIKELRLNF